MSVLVSVMLEEKPSKYVDALVETGLFGADRDEVVTSLVMDGLRSALERGLMSRHDFQAIRTGERH